AKADGIPNLRFALARELDALGIAAALEIKNSAVTPAVFIVTNQSALGIGRERGLAGSRKPEEQGAHTILADVCRAVHGKYVAFRQQKIHHAKYRFLHLAGVLRAANQHQLASEIYQNKKFGARAIAPGI